MAVAWIGASCSGGGSGGGGAGTGGNEQGSWSDGNNQDVDPNDIVGRIAVEAPEEMDFILRATMPVPPGLMTDGDLFVPLFVVNHLQKTAPTQVEIVSRYPSPEDGADVVELIGRVRRPEAAQPGDLLYYDVAYGPHTGGQAVPPSAVRSMLAAPGSLKLRTQDVFGNKYDADLYADVRNENPEARLLRDGELLQTYRTHELLLPKEPADGPTGTLPHLMGVHAYVTTFDRENLVALDIHVHNGMDGLTPSDPTNKALQDVYFDKLELRLPKGWSMVSAFDNPMLGEAYETGGWKVYPIVDDLPGDQLHLMPQQSRFVRRMVIHKDSADNEARAREVALERYRGFSIAGESSVGREYYSWWNDETARYFPQSHRLPSLEHVGREGIRQGLRNDLEGFVQQIATGSEGSYPLYSGNMGWSHPWGVSYGGMTGSDEINVFDGVEIADTASHAGYRLMQLVSRAYIDRQPTALFDPSGNPTQVEDLLFDGPGGSYVDCYFSLIPKNNSDPFGFTQAPLFQTEAVANLGRQPDYEEDLREWMPIDLQHYIRYTRTLKVLVWLGNDSFAKDEMQLAAELFRLSFHEHYNSEYSHIQSTGLRHRMERVLQYPGQGVDFRRGEAWGVDAVSTAYAVGDAGFRERVYPWFEKVLDVVGDGQSTCTGNIMASNIASLFSGQYLTRQAFESALVDNALRGMKETVFEGFDDDHSDRAGEIIVQSVYATISPGFWSETLGGPWFNMGVGPWDESQGEFCFNIPSNAHSANVDYKAHLSSFAYAYEVSGDEEFLSRAMQMLGGGELLGSLEGLGTTHLQYSAGLLALMQGMVTE